MGRTAARFEVGAVHEVARVRQAGGGDAGCLGQDREVRGDDACAGAIDPTDVLRRRRTPVDPDPGDRDARELERLVLE